VDRSGQPWWSSPFEGVLRLVLFYIEYVILIVTITITITITITVWFWLIIITITILILRKMKKSHVCSGWLCDYVHHKMINDDHDDHCYCNRYRYRYYHYCCSGQGIASPLKLAVSTQSPPARAARSSNLASEIRARWMSPSEWIPEPYEIPSGVSPVARKCPIN